MPLISSRPTSTIDTPASKKEVTLSTNPVAVDVSPVIIVPKISSPLMSDDVAVNLNTGIFLKLPLDNFSIFSFG